METGEVTFILSLICSVTVHFDEACQIQENTEEIHKIIRQTKLPFSILSQISEKPQFNLPTPEPRPLQIQDSKAPILLCSCTPHEVHSSLDYSHHQINLLHGPWDVQ
jgi:hypothetical protein